MCLGKGDYALKEFEPCVLYYDLTGLMVQFGSRRTRAAPALPLLTPCFMWLHLIWGTFLDRHAMVHPIHTPTTYLWEQKEERMALFGHVSTLFEGLTEINRDNTQPLVLTRELS